MNKDDIVRILREAMPELRQKVHFRFERFFKVDYVKIFLLFLFFSIEHTAFAQDSLNVSRVGSFLNLWQAAYRLEVSNNTAYVCTGRSGLEILDVTDPSNILPIGRIETYGWITDVEVEDTVAYIIDNDYGLYIYSIANPAEPRLISRFECLQPHCIVVSDSIAFVGGVYLTVINIANPSNPILIAQSREQLGIKTMVLDNGYLYGTDAYLSEPGNRFMIIQVAPPDRPRLVYSRSSQGYYGCDIYVEDNLLILLRRASTGFYDVSDKTNPIEIGRIVTGRSFELAVKDTILFVTVAAPFGREWRGLYIIDISDVRTPILIHEMEIDALRFAVEIEDNAAYLTDLRSGIGILDISNFDDPQWLGEYSTFDQHAVEIDIWEDVLSVGAAQQTWLFDMSAINSPQLLSTWRDENSNVHICRILFNDFLYDSYDPGSHTNIWNVSNPSRPALVRTLNWDFYEIQFIGHSGIYWNLSGIGIADLTNPGNPQVAGFQRNADTVEVYKMAVSDSILVTAWRTPILLGPPDYRGLNFYSVENQEELTLINNVRSEAYIDAMVLSGNNLFTATVMPRETIITISQIDARGIMTELNEFALPHELGMPDDCNLVVNNGNLIITQESFGVSILDISNLNQVTEVGRYATPGDARQFVLLGSNLVIAEESSCGIYNCSEALSIPILETTPKLSTFELYPNPFNSTTTISFGSEISDAKAIYVYDVRGRLIENLPVTKSRCIWNSSAYPSGDFIFVSDGNGRSLTRKATKLK